MFQFLTDVAANAGCKKFSPSLSIDIYGLAVVMVPGGADKRTKHGVLSGSIRKYLPESLSALKQRDMADETMLLMALATIRAETSEFRENYAKIGKEIGLGDQLVKDPDLADDPAVAASILAQFLENHEESIRAAVSKGHLAKARRLVNGGSHGLADFTSAFNAGRRFLNEPIIQTAKHKVLKKAATATHAAH